MNIEEVIEKVGSARKLAKEIQKEPCDITRIRRPKAKGGYGGKIPASWFNAILKMSARLNLDINAADLVKGLEK